MFEKLIENVMCNRLKLFLEKNNILYKYQFGFRENHSTAHALIDLMEYINTCLDQGKYVFGIYIDLKKAFDTVQHDILLSKLQHYGIRGKALNWFKSYLTDRKQFTKVNGVSSDFQPLHVVFTRCFSKHSSLLLSYSICAQILLNKSRVFFRALLFGKYLLGFSTSGKVFFGSFRNT